MTRVLLAATGVANIAAVLAGLTRAGGQPELCSDPAQLRTADLVVLPGVGAFGAAVDNLRASGLMEALAERLAQGRPTLAICLGLQILCNISEESPGYQGFSWLPTAVRRLAGGPGLRVPQMGWNWVEPTAGSRFLQAGHAYFANSYVVPEIPPGYEGAWTTHGERFASAIERGDVLACQFHPELSGAWGTELLRRWLAGSTASTNAGVGGADQSSSADGNKALTRRIIPCLDVRDGRVVKGTKFQNLRDAGDPVELASLYGAQGADELCLLDVSATPKGRATAIDTVAAVRAQLSIPLTVGGGIRKAENAAALLQAGADKIGVNTAAVARPKLLTELADAFGRQCVVLAVDAARDPAGSWVVVVRSGSERVRLDAVDWIRQGADLGAGEILLTSWDRDGTRAGYDLELVRAVSEAVELPVIASGGADGPQHLLEGLNAGADAVLAASIFHQGEWTVGALKSWLRERGVGLRP